MRGSVGEWQTWALPSDWRTREGGPRRSRQFDVHVPADQSLVAGDQHRFVIPRPCLEQIRLAGALRSSNTSRR